MTPIERLSLRETLLLEWRVATSPRAQPAWFRLLKWTVMLLVVWSYWDAPYLWWSLGAVLAMAIALHLLWRTKTRRWTQPWRGWSDVEIRREFERRLP
jgi:hypothetical protein